WFSSSVAPMKNPSPTPAPAEPSTAPSNTTREVSLNSSAETVMLHDRDAASSMKIAVSKARKLRRQGGNRQNDVQGTHKENVCPKFFSRVISLHCFTMSIFRTSRGTG